MKKYLLSMVVMAAFSFGTTHATEVVETITTETEDVKTADPESSDMMNEKPDAVMNNDMTSNNKKSKVKKPAHHHIHHKHGKKHHHHHAHGCKDDLNQGTMKMEKCLMPAMIRENMANGVAGMDPASYEGNNDCQKTVMHVEGDANAWLWLPKGTCGKIVGASVVPN